MKTIMAVFLLLISTSLLAEGNECAFSGDPSSCGDVMSNRGGNIAAVPEPGALALIALGLAGLVVARKRKK